MLLFCSLKEGQGEAEGSGQGLPSAQGQKTERFRHLPQQQVSQG